ncbi:NADH-quinone oxidoreductase subunit A [Buchnera aphidicola]|uniref:NADH-quinone oxidoreductase subunit A n=1 Tax=Buchnera aphidicola TaxID=9 RepID=UPI0034640914
MQNYQFMLFIFSSFSICIFMLLAGCFLGSYNVSRKKNIPFESGITSYGDTNIRFSIKFYLLAVLFVLFDVEALYIYTWSISIRKIGWMGFFEIFIFIVMLILSLVYLVKENVFSWTPKKSNNIINNIF